MKHFYSLLSSLLVAMAVQTGLVCAQTILEVSEPGTLEEQLASQSDLSHLIISGTLNANDFGALRQSQGVSVLDLSNVQIAAGGSYEGNPYMGVKVETVPGEMPGYFLFSGSLSETLTEITLPGSVTRLGVRCLQNGSKLTSIILPEELTYIGELSLGYCEALKQIDIPETVDSIAGAAFQGDEQLQSIQLPENLKYLGGSAFTKCASLSEIELPEGLHTLYAATFKECSALETVQLPEMMSRIENFAFDGCTALESVVLPYLLREMGNYVFSGCSSLSSVEFHSQELKSIGDQAFKDCTALEKIVLPAGIEKIGGLAFSGCNSLQTAVLPAKLQTIMGGSFAGTALTNVIIPAGCTEIGYGAFANCHALEEAVLPKNLKKVGEAAFGKCDALTTIIVTGKIPSVEEKTGDLCGIANLSVGTEITLIVPAGTRTAYSEAEIWRDFSNIQEGLKLTTSVSEEEPLSATIEKLSTPALYLSAQLTGTVTADDLSALSELSHLREIDLAGIACDEETNPLEGMAFSDFPYLRKLTFPKQLKQIGDYACSQVFNLEEVVLPEQLEAIGEEGFSYCTALKQITLPKTTLSLGESVFQGCASMQSVSMPDELELIPDYAFVDCISLTNLHLPKKASDIGEMAFTNCVRIDSLILPGEVTEIKPYAFIGCDGLVGIRTLAAEPPYLSESAFTPAQYEDISVIVPTEAIRDAYQNAEGWSLFKNYKVVPDDTSVNTPAPDAASVYGGDGCLTLSLTGAANYVSVYRADGTCIIAKQISEGTHSFPLAPGLYVVSVNRSTYKAYVR